ncbi:MAG: hypothetical protein KF819_01520 [Labilithrix sp.]|nr:hypothetical protein [Labilithrix sp.]
MRGYATFFLIAVMTLGLAFLLVTRSRTPHDAPAERPPETSADAGDAGADAGPDASVAVASASASASAKPAERPMRVVTLGWELAAPAVALAGDKPSNALIEIAPETALDAVEARLARGGSDAVGADVAILPLPAFVVAYEKLRALEPRAFAVVGFSRGREELHAAPGALLKPPAGTDEVKLVGLGPSTASDATARAGGSESATVLGFFALDLLGVPPARVRLVGPGAPEAKAAPFAAIARGASDDRKLALSTADASKLVPIVAVAPKKLLDESEAKMKELTRSWLDGIVRAGKDASNVSRRLANKEAVPLAAGVGGAPEAIALLDRLGQIEPVALADQRAVMGPGATSPVTLESLSQRTWGLSRAAGLTTIAAPDPLPIDARVVTAIAPAPAVPEKPDAGADADAGAATFGAPPAGAAPLLVYRAVDVGADAASVAAQIGFLASVFPRAAFRVSAKGGEKAARAIATAAKEKFDLPASRLATVAAEPAGAFASVEILALP